MGEHSTYDPRSLYQQAWTKEEYDALVRDFSVLGHTPILHPFLSTFAVAAKDPQRVMQAIADYTEYVLHCPCWHCLEIRKKVTTTGISGQDVWYRLILCANGPPQHQLN